MADERSRVIGNLGNFRTMPFIENYEGKYQRSYSEKLPNGMGRKEVVDKELIPFKYADGTTDSYVKRGFDEDYVQKLERYESVEHEYRIFTTEASIKFRPKDYIYIGDTKMRIYKVLPLMNLNDSLKMYNYTGATYRDIAPKLIYLR